MKERWIGVLALMVTIFTSAWVVLLVISLSGAPQIDSIEDQIAFVVSQGRLYSIMYLNAALLTFFTILFMSAIYVYSRERSALWATIAFTFVPIYGLINLLAYLSQVIIVPPLLVLYVDPSTSETAKILLGFALHTWPGSTVGAVNSLAYAMLGIPTIVFPLISMRKPMMLAVGGFLLALSGVMSIGAFFGLLTSIDYLTYLSIPGGVVFLVSLIPISIHFFKF